MVIAVPEYRLAYAAVPKAGCSSVKAMLAQVDPNVALPPLEKTTNRTWHALYPTQRYRKWRWKQYRSDFFFTVIRDPVKRLMSVYTNRVVQKRELFKSRNIKSGHLGLPADPDPDFFFQNLREYMQAAAVIKHHALPTWMFTGRDLAFYDCVFRTDEMNELAHELSERTGSLVESMRANSSEQRLEFDDLASETRDALRPVLIEEYVHLRGYFDNPMR